jgi:hypothetical protein
MLLAYRTVIDLIFFTDILWNRKKLPSILSLVIISPLEWMLGSVKRVFFSCIYWDYNFVFLFNLLIWWIILTKYNLELYF